MTKFSYSKLKYDCVPFSFSAGFYLCLGGDFDVGGDYAAARVGFAGRVDIDAARHPRVLADEADGRNLINIILIFSFLPTK